MKFSERLILEALQELAEKGLTVRQAADHTGMTVQTIYRYVEKHQIALLLPGAGRPRSGLPPDDRSVAMANMYQSGKTLLEIGDQYGVTRERVRQILRKDHGFRSEDGGAAERKRQARKKFQQDRDKRCLRKYGCDYRQYRQILKQPNHPVRRFIEQKRNAKERGVGWELNLWQWWSLWLTSGHWENRGRGEGYAMCRLNDAGPYAPDNVYIATNRENIQDYYVRRRAEQAAA